MFGQGKEPLRARAERIDHKFMIVVMQQNNLRYARMVQVKFANHSQIFRSRLGIFRIHDHNLDP